MIVLIMLVIYVKSSFNNCLRQVAVSASESVAKCRISANRIAILRLSRETLQASGFCSIASMWAGGTY
jgi:hypothetical protein